MAEKPEMNYKDLLSGLDINKGDILDVASDVMSIMMYSKKAGLKFDPNALIDELKQMVGPEGTVMIRTFTWDFCHNEPFDILKSPSRVGGFGNVAMKRDDFKRTPHPLYSWMVWGKHMEELCSMDNICAFGENTPFDFLYKLNAKQLTIGNTAADACTQMHHAEAVAKVPYRREKCFTGEYIDEAGQKSIRTYSMYVRPLDLKVTNLETDRDERGQKLISEGIMLEKYYDDSLRCAITLLHEVTDFFVNDINNNEGKFIVMVNDCEGYKSAGVDYSNLKI